MGRASNGQMVQHRDIAPEKMARLMGFLGGLPGAAASKLFATLEADKARGGLDLPHGEMLEKLRSRLFEENIPLPRRPLTAQRIFFEPFEDFFVAERRGRKRRARIARASINPIWSLVTDDPACLDASRAVQALNAAIREIPLGEQPSGDAAQALADRTQEMFAAAEEGIGRLLAHAESDDVYRNDLADRLGGSTAYHDLVELQLMIDGADHLRKMQGAFKKPVATLTEEDLFNIRRIYAAAYAESQDAAPYVLLCLAARMDAPWRALGVYYHLRDAKDEALDHAQKDAVVISEVLFEDLESMARAMERDSGAAFHASEAGFRIRHFADFADGMQREAERRNDSVVVKRVEACRDVAADALDRFTEQSAAAMRKAMPVRHAGGSSRLMALRPDIGRLISPTLAREGHEAAQFLAQMDETSRRLKRRNNASDILGDTVNHAKRYANDLVTEIRAAEGEDRSAARRLMDHTLNLITPLLPEEEVGLLRDRASAAAISA